MAFAPAKDLSYFRRVFAAVFGLAALCAVWGIGDAGAQPTAGEGKGFQYESLRWIDEREDPSITIETDELVVKVIDNTGLKVKPTKRSADREPDYGHYLGYHAIRALWNKTERRNIVAPFYSWLNLQAISVEGLKLDPVDSRALYGVARGWPIRLEKDGNGAILRLARMPVSGIEYSLRLQPGGSDAIDFEVSFTLHEKAKDKAKFYASWPCYMSALDEVQLHSPIGDPAKPEWKAYGSKPDFVLGEPVNYVHSQKAFKAPEPLAFPAAYGRIGSRVLVLMFNRPEVKPFIVNSGGHRPYMPVQNPAWDFSFAVPDYEKGKPFGFRGRIIYKTWQDSDEIVRRYHEWIKGAKS